MKTNLILATLILGLTGAVYAGQPENVGTLNITVLDENGTLVPDAPVYIYGEHKTHFVGGKEIPGTTTLAMPAGTYRISSALMKKTGDYYDRFSSHEAHIQVVPGDNAVVVLTLRPLQDPAVAAAYMELGSSQIPTDLARSFN